MLERSVACSDLSSLHSDFSTGIVLLMSPLHNRCHVSVRLRAVQNLRGFSGYDCNAEQGQLILSSSVRHSVESSSGAGGANKQGQLTAFLHSRKIQVGVIRPRLW